MSDGVVVVVVFKAHLAGRAVDIVKDDPMELLDYLGPATSSRLISCSTSFSLSVETRLAVALQIALSLQIDQRIFDLLLVSADIEVGLIDQQDGDVKAVLLNCCTHLRRNRL